MHPDNDFIVVRGKSSFGERQGFREVPFTEEGREMVACRVPVCCRCSEKSSRRRLVTRVFARLAHNACYARVRRGASCSRGRRKRFS
jgi:hypothetical protein